MRAPRWMYLLTALLALGGGTGCPDPAIPCISGAPPQLQDMPVVGVGSEVIFSIRADLTRACDVPDSPRQPESVTVEVKDPENQPVPATVALAGNGDVATLRFTPTVKGRHHVIVAFAPVGSLHQFGIFAGEDRRLEPALASLPAGTTCPYVDRTARGAWLCGAEARRELAAEPQALGTSPDGPTAVAGDVVWMVDGNRVLRYVDTGSGPLELTGTAPYPPGGNPGSFNRPHAQLATPDELVVLSNALLHRYTFTEADGIATAPTTTWVPQGFAPFGADNVVGLLVRGGARLLVVTRVSDPRTFETRTQACPFLPGEGGLYQPVSGEACHALVGEPVGYEEGVVWTRTFEMSTGAHLETLRRYTAASGRLLEEGTLTLDGQLTTGGSQLRPGPAVPVLRPLGANEPVIGPRWNATRGLLELELLPAPAGGLLGRLGEQFLWVSFGGNGISVYPRQSTR